MASSKLVTTNPDLPRQSSICSLSSIIADHNDPSKTLGSMSMDDLLKSIYSSSEPNQAHHDTSFNAGGGGGASISRQGSLSLPKEMGAKTVDEVWKEIVTGGSDQRRAGAGEDGVPLEEMTLEDFLTKAGAVREEDVRGVTNVVAAPGSYHVGPVVVNGGGQFPMEGSSLEVFGNGAVDGAVVGVAASAVGGGGGRGKRRAVEEHLDKATLQKQRRMIKNRESAARSRERKQVIFF